ncbi:MAG: hypothetical protein CMP28_14590 [Roseibacillus sp.]|nr:hypothetical protein [Roseibacillus sp.]
MKSIRFLPFVPLVAVFLLPVASGEEQPAAKKGEPGVKVEAAAGDQEKEPTDFIRIHEDEKTARLQTSVTTYEKNGVRVDLIGAVHIGDKKYYEELNKSFKNYEVLLFEMVGGENIGNGNLPEREEGGGDIQTTFLRGMVDGMSRFLKLSSQVQEIDYSPGNFVHADLTMKQFEKKQQENGESLFGFALAAAQQAQNQGVEQPNPARLLAALLSGNSDGLKLEMMKSLGQGDDQIAALAGNNVIIGQRNAKCLKVFRKQVKKGRKNIGIFYGAAHYPDMENRLLKMGYRKGKQSWMTAWDVPKPGQPQKKAAGGQGGEEKAEPAEAR